MRNAKTYLGKDMPKLKTRSKDGKEVYYEIFNNEFGPMKRCFWQIVGYQRLNHLRTPKGSPLMIVSIEWHVFTNVTVRNVYHVFFKLQRTGENERGFVKYSNQELNLQNHFYSLIDQEDEQYKTNSYLRRAVAVSRNEEYNETR